MKKAKQKTKPKAISREGVKRLSASAARRAYVAKIKKHKPEDASPKQASKRTLESKQISGPLRNETGKMKYRRPRPDILPPQWRNIPGKPGEKEAALEGFIFWLYTRSSGSKPFTLRLDNVHGVNLGEFTVMSEVNDRVIAYVLANRSK